MSIVTKYTKLIKRLLVRIKRSAELWIEKLTELLRKSLIYQRLPLVLFAREIFSRIKMTCLVLKRRISRNSIRYFYKTRYKILRSSIKTADFLYKGGSFRSARILLVPIVKHYDYQNKVLNTKFLMCCIKTNYFTGVDRFLDNVSKNATCIELPYFGRVLDWLDRENERYRLNRCRSILKYVTSRTADEYILEWKLRHEKFQSLETELESKQYNYRSAVETQILVQSKIFLIKYEEAYNILASTICSADYFSKRAEKLLRRNIFSLSSIFDTPKPILDEYIERYLKMFQLAIENNEENMPYKEIFSLHDNYLITKNFTKSAYLNDRVDLNKALPDFAKSVYRWLCIYHSSAEVAAYFQEAHIQHRYHTDIKILYAQALIANNELERALTVLEGMKQISAVKYNLLLRIHTILDNKQESKSCIVKSLKLNPEQEALWTSLIAIDTSDDIGESKRLYESLKKYISDAKKTRIHLEFVKNSNKFNVDWKKMLTGLIENFNRPTANQLLSVSFAKENREYFLQVAQLIIDKCPDSKIFDVSNHIKSVANYLYRTGEKALFMELIEKIDLGKSDIVENMLISLGQGKTVEGLHARSAALEDTYLKRYKHEYTYDIDEQNRVLSPEKDLAGEVFLSFFFQAELSRNGVFTVMCDKRLKSIYQRNYPDIKFVGKEPRSSLSKNRNAFDKVPLSLCDFIDNNCLTKVKKANYFHFDISDYYYLEACQNNRKSGWLEADLDLRRRWEEDLGKFDNKTLIGFSVSSMMHSPIRNVHSIGLDLWGDIFKMENVVFINLNTSLEENHFDTMSIPESAIIYTPNCDLYNDFEQLIALLSLLDYGILPANNLMEFASSVGLKSFIFSPTGIMRNWAMDESNSYVFSEQVKFIFSKDSEVNKAGMVAELVTKLNNDIAARK